MQTLANPGSTVIAESTRKLVEGYFALKPLGATKVKGVSEPVNVYEVVGLGPLRTRLQRSAGRGLTKFVGREREMEALKHAAEQTRSGHGQIAAAMAEPGVGKSRLFFEFKATSAAGWMVLETFSVSHGKASAYLPVIDLLRNYFDISAADDERKRREKVAGRIAILDRSLEDTLPYLFSLLGIVEGDDPLAQMDGQIKKRRTLEAIKRIALRESLNQPLMVIFEDLHWIDEQTQELLNLLADSIGTAKFLLLVNYRPEYRHEWGHKTYYTQLRLDPLGKDSAEEMLTALLGDGQDLLPLKRLIIERTEGTPFFMEEMVQAFFEDGVLQRNGAVKLTKSINAVKVPATVQAILASRIDRLPPAEKELLQTLAVIGREFALSLVRRVVDGRADDELNRMLGALQMAEFIYEQPATGDVEYIFKHALTQEVAYNSLLIERRKLLHERAGRALESIFAGQLDDHLNELAHQYRRSDNVEKAVEYLGRAGQQAAERSAHREAIELLTSALELLQRLPTRPERGQLELELLTALGPVLMITKGWAAPEVEKVYLLAYELSQQSGVAAQRFSALIGLYGLAFSQGKLHAAREREEQLLSFAQQQQEPALLLEAHHMCWSTALSLGELATAQAHIEKGLALFDSQLHHANARVFYGAHDPAVCGRAWGALTSWLRGYPAQALRSNDSALAMARELEHPFSVAFALTNAAQLHQLLREAPAAKEQAEAALAVEGGFPYILSWGPVLRGWALAEQGQAEEGIARIRDGLAALRATGMELWRSYGLSLLAEGCGRAGQINEGMEALGEALAIVGNNAEHWCDAELYRIRGELLLRQNYLNAAEAQGCFERAIEIALKQSAKSWELRATTSLARLLRDTGRRDEARTMLAEIYGWFTEGFDTADLKDAKALLDQLNS
jgi:predicted ATPase